MPPHTPEYAHFLHSTKENQDSARSISLGPHRHAKSAESPQAPVGTVGTPPEYPCKIQGRGSFYRFYVRILTQGQEAYPPSPSLKPPAWAGGKQLGAAARPPHHVGQAWLQLARKQTVCMMHGSCLTISCNPALGFLQSYHESWMRICETCSCAATPSHCMP